MYFPCTFHPSYTLNLSSGPGPRIVHLLSLHYTLLKLCTIPQNSLPNWAWSLDYSCIVLSLSPVTHYPSWNSLSNWSKDYPCTIPTLYYYDCHAQIACQIGPGPQIINALTPAFHQ